MISGIYQIKNLRNGKVYVGRSVNVDKRLNDHFKSLREGTHPNSHLQSSWDKWGEESFESSLLEATALDDLCQREAHWINELGACDRARGYNMRIETGDGSWQLSEDTKEKWSKLRVEHWAEGRYANHPWADQRGENNTRWGVTLDDDLRQKISRSVNETFINEPERWAKSPETRESMRQGAKKRWADTTQEEKAAAARKRAAGVKNRTQSEETRKKKSESMKRTLAAKKLQKEAEKGVLLTSDVLNCHIKEEMDDCLGDHDNRHTHA